MQNVSPDGRRWKLSSAGAATALFFVALWFFWGVRYGDYLFAVQENSFFIYRWDFFSRWLETPDGLLCYLTAFVIQFFYYPLLGSAILAGLGVVVQRLAAKLFDLHGSAYAASFVPTCMLVVASTWPGFYIYIPFNVPLIFSEYLALILTFAVLLGYRRVPNVKARMASILAFVALGYLGFGAWSAIAGVLCALDEVTRRDETVRTRVLRFAILFVGALAIPVALQRFWLFPRLQIYNVFTCGILEDVRYDKDSLTATFAYGFAMAAPIYIAAVYLLTRLLALRATSDRAIREQARLEREARKLEKKEQKERKGKKDKNERKTAVKTPETTEEERLALVQKRERKRTQLLFELLFLLFCATYTASFHTRSFFDCLASCRALTNADWNRILEIDSKNPFPSVHMVGLRNLALYKTGRLAEEAFKRPVGGESTIGVNVADNAKAISGSLYYKAKIRMFELKQSTEVNAGRAQCGLVFCHWGLSNIGARTATDNFVATENRSISFLMTLASAALINGERELARRYLNELEFTLFYKDWARVRLAYLDSADFYQGVRDFNSDEEYYKAKESRRAEDRTGLALEEAARGRGVSLDELKRVVDLIAQARADRPTRDVESKKAFPNPVFLLEIIQLDDYETASLEKKETILIAALLQKKSQFFLEHVEDYLKEKGCAKGGAPTAIEEGYATWRYHEYNSKWRDCEYQFTSQTIDGIDVFDTCIRKFGTTGIAAQAALRDCCAGTYWGFAIDETAFYRY